MKQTPPFLSYKPLYRVFEKYVRDFNYINDMSNNKGKLFINIGCLDNSCDNIEYAAGNIVL